MINTQEVNQQEDNNISQLCNSAHSEQATKIINELNDDSIYGKIERKILQLIDVLKNVDKLNVKQIKDVLLNEVHFTSRRSIYNYLPDDMKRKYEHKPLEHKADVIDRVEQSVSSEIVDPDPDNVSLIDKPVYREPDRVEPRPTWNKDKMDTEQEQQFNTDYHRMNVQPNIQVENRQDMKQGKQVDTSYTTEARLNLRDKKMNRDFYVMLTVNCYPDKQTVEIEPIDKASIVYVKPDQ